MLFRLTATRLIALSLLLAACTAPTATPTDFRLPRWANILDLQFDQATYRLGVMVTTTVQLQTQTDGPAVARLPASITHLGGVQLQLG